MEWHASQSIAANGRTQTFDFSEETAINRVHGMRNRRKVTSQAKCTATASPKFLKTRHPNREIRDSGTVNLWHTWPESDKACVDRQEPGLAPRPFYGFLSDR